jgi:hypothetical protein
LATDLILRHLRPHGSATLSMLHSTLKLSFTVLESMFHQLRQQQALEVKGMRGNDYSFSLTSSGRALATGRNQACQYAGPAPVSLAQYDEVVKAQSARVRWNREALGQAFADLVLPEALLDRLDPSLIGRSRCFFIAAPATILVPYAVEVDGRIVTLFDPVVHRAVPNEDETLDPRRAPCERPCITVGGGLSASMLELRLDESSPVFIAPCRLKANNGIRIVDDFGRRMLSPRELLNRWIVPLDRHLDYLTPGGICYQPARFLI